MPALGSLEGVETGVRQLIRRRPLEVEQFDVGGKPSSSMDDYYADQQGPEGVRIATQVVKQLAEPLPYDLDEVELSRYRQLAAQWQDWHVVAAACRRLAADVLDLIAEERT